MDTHSCLTHIPACNVVISPSLPELQLLPVTKRHTSKNMRLKNRRLHSWSKVWNNYRFWKTSLRLSKAAFIWSNINTNNKKCFRFDYILKLNWFLWCKAELSASLLLSSVSHDPSEIILIWWFANFCLKKKMGKKIVETVIHWYSKVWGNSNFLFK